MKFSSERGSIVLEYLLTLTVAIPFLIVWLELYEPGSGYTQLGVEFTGYFRRMLVGLSLPIP